MQNIANDWGNTNPKGYYHEQVKKRIPFRHDIS